MERVKFKKPRKKMSAKQRAAAAERLAKARAKKAPAKNKSVHPSVLALPDNHYLSYIKVKQWIKTQKELAASYKRDANRNVKGAIAKEYACRGYLNQMNHYIMHGDWCSDYYGEYEEKKIKWTVIE